MTPLSLEPSRAIHALLGDYETEKSYAWARIKSFVTDEEEVTYSLLPTAFVSEWKAKGGSVIPSPTFAELIRVLPRIAEKIEGIDKEYFANAFVNDYMDSATEPEGMKAVEEYLMKLLA